jgi:hypothetical protein
MSEGRALLVPSPYLAQVLATKLPLFKAWHVLYLLFIYIKSFTGLRDMSGRFGPPVPSSSAAGIIGFCRFVEA